MKPSRLASRLFPAFVLWCGAASANSIVVAAGADWNSGGSMVIREDNSAYVYGNGDFGNGLPAQRPIGPQIADANPQPVPEPQTLVPVGITLIALSLGLRRGIRKRP